jgi:hypothetical protein
VEDSELTGDEEPVVADPERVGEEYEGVLLDCEDVSPPLVADMLDEPLSVAGTLL